TGLIKNANSTWLNGRPLDRDLARALGRPVRLQNDANCLAVSEAADGAAAGAEVVFAAILRTGVGAGIVVHWPPLKRPNALPPPSPANGATTSCPGCATRGGGGQPATATSMAASRRFSLAQGWRATTAKPRATTSRRCRSPAWPRRATPRPRRRSAATRIGSPA